MWHHILKTLKYLIGIRLKHSISLTVSPEISAVFLDLDCKMLQLTV